MAGCSVCKSELMEGARFCVKCGNAVGSVIRETAVGDAVQEPAAPGQALSATTTAVVKRQSSGLLRILLLITVVLTVLIALAFISVINTGARSAIIGRWQADLGYVMLWGDVTENLEFFPNGSVTSDREIAFSLAAISGWMIRRCASTGGSRGSLVTPSARSGVLR